MLSLTTKWFEDGIACLWKQIYYNYGFLSCDGNLQDIITPFNMLCWNVKDIPGRNGHKVMYYEVKAWIWTIMKEAMQKWALTMTVNLCQPIPIVWLHMPFEIFFICLLAPFDFSIILGCFTILPSSCVLTLFYSSPQTEKPILISWRMYQCGPCSTETFCMITVTWAHSCYSRARTRFWAFWYKNCHCFIWCEDGCSKMAKGNRVPLWHGAGSEPRGNHWFSHVLGVCLCLCVRIRDLIIWKRDA